MARPLAAGSLSLTGAGAALVTDAVGAIAPDAVAGLLVDDMRVMSEWRLDLTGAEAHFVGRRRTGPSSDELLLTVRQPGVIDPVALLARDRTVSGRGMTERVRLTAYAAPLACALTLTAARDDRTMYEIGTPVDNAGTAITLSPDGFVLPSPTDGEVATVSAPGWGLDDRVLTVDIDVAAGATWESTITIHVPSATRADRAEALTAPADLDPPAGLRDALAVARADLAALALPLGRRTVCAAGSPYFLALFGRDSMVTALHAIVDGHERLLDTLHVLAEHQATDSDEKTRAEPGRIVHELRLGRADVFVPAGTPYYGAVDTAPLFAVALGEAAHWGAPLDDVAALVPAARAAVAWCREHGDVDGDGFVESVPDPGGLTNLGWKDSGDSIVDRDGRTIVGRVALSEVQAYWYRGARSLAEIERLTGLGDGAGLDAEADRLARQFGEQFVFDDGDGPFVGLALDEDKRLLDVVTSNAGHVLWSGVLPPDVGAKVATRFAAPDMFSGWGVRTLSRSAAGYNPFGYHRGTVWPHDTAFALVGAARYGDGDVVRTLAGGLVGLATALDGELPELLSGLARDETVVPIPYPAACRPQAWAAATPFAVVRALLGLEPDVPAGVVRIHPQLPAGERIEVDGLRLGRHSLSFVARGDEVVDADAPTLDVITGPEAVLATTPWCSSPS